MTELVLPCIIYSLEVLQFVWVDELAEFFIAKFVHIRVRFSVLVSDLFSKDTKYYVEISVIIVDNLNIAVDVHK